MNLNSTLDDVSMANIQKKAIPEKQRVIDSTNRNSQNSTISLQRNKKSVAFDFNKYVQLLPRNISVTELSLEGVRCKEQHRLSTKGITLSNSNMKLKEPIIYFNIQSKTD